jgi:3-hydroxyacyl-CoA dehydrogenase
MDYTQKLQKVAVLGAAGKMGSGITLLTLLEMANLLLKPENKNKSFVLYAIDISEDALTGLQKYIRTQVLKAAEKKTVWLRKVYTDRKDLIENEEIINQYVSDVLGILRPVKTLEAAFDVNLIFEAISEDVHVKTRILKIISDSNKNQPWFFSNTSSIPIRELDKSAGLGGRIIGFHFYNPPAVQKLVELISSDNTLDELKKFSMEYAKNIGKKIIPSHDVAGFIGNGHFMRDALYGISQAEELAREMKLPEAIFAINKISQDYLVRPMGIFQLMDYVGLDVCQLIMRVMNPHFPNENIHSQLLDKMNELGIKGGQNSDGSQKDGFLKYEKNQPVAVYNLETGTYTPLETFKDKLEKFFGSLPAGLKPWKSVVGSPDKEKMLKNLFSEMRGMQSKGTILAVEYFNNSGKIAKQLVDQKIAYSAEDVNAVLMNGFYHAYGPINNY